MTFDNLDQDQARAAAVEMGLPPGVPPLTSLYLYIAGACNLACSHCWIAPGFDPNASNGRFITPEHVAKVVREAKPLGLRMAKLTGGEPTLHPQFREIVTSIRQQGVLVDLETNGTLMDASLARFCREQGVNFISVSVDGATARTHDRLRRVVGAHERALAGIHALVAEGYHPQLICTLHRGNVGEMADVIALAETAHCGSVKFNLIQAVGRGEDYARESGLQVNELVDLYHQVEHQLAPRFQIPIHFDIPYAFRPIRRLVTGQLTVCHVKNILGVLAGGELSLCGIGVTVPSLVYGYLDTDKLRTVWCESPGLVRLRTEIPNQLEGICGNCLHRDLCLGACIASNFHTTGRVNAAYRFCSEAEALGIFPASRKTRS